MINRTAAMFRWSSQLIRLPVRRAWYGICKCSIQNRSMHLALQQQQRSVSLARNLAFCQLNAAAAAAAAATSACGILSIGISRAQGKRFICTSTDEQAEDLKTTLEKMRQLIEEYKKKGYDVPSSISDYNLEYLSSLSKNKRRKYIKHLYVKEQEKLLQKQKKEQKDTTLHNTGRSEDLVGEAPNTFLRRVQKGYFTLLEDWRLAAAMKFNPEVVFDFTFENLMKWNEIRHLVMQLSILYNANANAKEPFHIHCVNFNHGGLVERELKKMYQNRYDDLMLSINTRGLLDVFQRNRIVYLSPDSNNILTSYDPEKVYVIGALVDTGLSETGASLSQAKRLGLQHCRLPLDEYLQWGPGGQKNLTLDAVMNILISAHEHGNIAAGLEKYVPKRKHLGLKPCVKNVGSKMVEERQFAFSRAKQSRKWDIEGDADAYSRHRSKRRNEWF